MKDSPIIFTGPMLRAILEGRKSQTRRFARFKPTKREAGLRLLSQSLKVGNYFTGHPDTGWVLYSMRGSCWHMVTERLYCPYGVPGDRLWVREGLIRPDGDPWIYRADDQPVMVSKANETEMLVWAYHKEQDYCSSRFMPRWASRITLEITGVRVERVQDITYNDVLSEGLTQFLIDEQQTDAQHMADARRAYANLWNRINSKRGCGWDINPWVWVIDFRRIL